MTATSAQLWRMNIEVTFEADNVEDASAATRGSREGVGILPSRRYRIDSIGRAKKVVIDRA